jgi:hypothetical protein
MLVIEKRQDDQWCSFERQFEILLSYAVVGGLAIQKR